DPMEGAACAAGIASIWSATESCGSRTPATSVAKHSIARTPSCNAKGTEYVSQAPPSTRYTRLATPLVPSDAVRVTVTLLTYHPFSPAVPDREADVVGGVVSIPTSTELTGSTFPARSTAQ